jgi:hypothetical protein
MPDRVREVLIRQFWSELSRLTMDLDEQIAENNIDGVYTNACHILDLIDRLREPDIPATDGERAVVKCLD